MNPPIVHIVDDDPSVRKSLCRLVRAHGYDARAFASADDFLKSAAPGGPSCLLLDVRMPGMDGMRLQEILNTMEDRNVPVIFITGHADVPTTVRAMKAGAVDFLQKPFNDTDLLKAVRSALEKDAGNIVKKTRAGEIKSLLRTLTPREHEIFALVATGMLNKQVAGRLGICEKTVKVHRGRVMAKMKAESFADLVRLAQEAGVKSPFQAV
jgi:FixJ family two-component response regulator